MNLKNVHEIIKGTVGDQQILVDVPMKEHTSMRVGGLAAMLITPSSIQEIAEIKRHLYRMQIPHYIMGNGTNLVVADEGYPGIIVKLAENFSSVSVKNEELVCLAGTLLVSVSQEALKNSLTGLEFAAGIPGTVGGAVAMNAGAYDGEMKDVVVQTVCMDEQGEIIILQGEEQGFGYRTSRIQKERLFALEVTMKLQKGNAQEIKDKMQLLNSRRRDKQPLHLPSAGSVFKRPEGHYAGKLIEDAGLKGYRIGGAQVSEKHCGFIVNTGTATATEVITLIQYVKDKVFERFQVTLEQEVRILGG